MDKSYTNAPIGTELRSGFFLRAVVFLGAKDYIYNQIFIIKILANSSTIVARLLVKYIGITVSKTM
jgi:hypothetical protein